MPGVQISGVWDLNILLLAPGGHLGRFIIWTKDAFEQLQTVFGSWNQPSAVKKNYFLPRPVLTNSDIKRVIFSDSVVAVSRVKTPVVKLPKKPNYTRNVRALDKLDPYRARYLRLRREIRYVIKL